MIAKILLIAVSLVANYAAFGQWQIQTSNTDAGLRGIHAVDGSVAWASGTGGIVLRTQDGGAHWEKCATPPGAEKLDFRGIWAWDANNAIVMSSGPGEASRLFETTDGCQHWTEERKNSDPEGFWDAVVFQALAFRTAGESKAGVLVGDPIKGRVFTLVRDSSQGWLADEAACATNPDEAMFAASNSAVFVFGSGKYIVGTGGKGGPRVLLSPLLAYGDASKGCLAVPVPVAGGTESSGVFSLVLRDTKNGVTVGGDYKRPDDATGTAAWTDDGGRHWTAASKPPHGYRSAVAWDAGRKAWIAVGTNGSDTSRDDGKTWQPLDDSNWNALSLPFVVGLKGKIGKLKAGVANLR